MPLKTNSQLGHFTILSGIAKGGMGEVYLANDTKLERKVALKVLPSELTRDKERLQRFEQEARAVSALNHPYLLTIFEFGVSDDGVHYIATEYVDGQTLSQFGSETRIPLIDVLDIAMQVASALSAAHEAGIAHRDIKPDNIMVRPDGYIKVLDFGLAKLTELGKSGDADLEASTKPLFNTSPGSVVGTAAYMSPEQARGVEVDARTDLWSLGVVLYEMITGVKPFYGETATDTIVSVIEREPAPINSYVKTVPSDLVWIITKTLAKKPDGRYQTAKELHADLARIKKQVEFEDQIERSQPPDARRQDDTSELPTMIHEHVPTSPGEATVTKPRHEGLAGPADPRTTSSLEYAVMQAKAHKAFAVVFSLILVAFVSLVAYFAYIAGTGPEQIDSIAVLPFENGSKDESLKYLSDGLSESLIDRLSQLPQLKVIARNSSFKFRGDNLDLKDIASQLGVRAIITGQVIQFGDELTIRVEVIDAVENKQIWGQRFNRRFKDVLAIQNEIAQTVSQKLRLKLTNDQEKRLADGGTTNPEAFRYYLNGLVELKGPQDVRGKALEFFEKAVELDPNFALAQSEVALIYIGRALGAGNPAELMPKAVAATEKALKIDDTLALPHLAQASIREYEFDWAGADTEYKRAIELNPNLHTARNRYAFFLAIMGRHAEALRQIDEARLRDPANISLILEFKAIIQIQARKFDDAIKTFDEVSKLAPEERLHYFVIGYAYAGQKSYQKAIENYQKSIKQLGTGEKYSQPLVYLAAAYAKTPANRSKAVDILKKLESSSDYVSPSILAVIYVALGEKEKALAALEKAYLERDVLLRYIGVGYEYDEIRGEPRFKALLKRTGLEIADK